MEMPGEVRAVLTALERAGYGAYCVGGCVRDLLLGRRPEDWDVTTDAQPQEVLSLFGGRARPTGLRHGTVTVESGGWSVEVTTYRVDGRYADHRHPGAVTFTPALSEDLKRRDFTVNAMAMDLRGRLIDEWGGQADLQNRLLRCVGEPAARFDEDALRILRCLRFAAVLGFAVETRTALALREQKELLRALAPERVYAELTKLICGGQMAAVLLAYPEVIGAVLPEILPSVGFDQRNPHHCYDVWEHTVRSMEHIPPQPLLRWVMLLHDLGKPAVCVYDGAAGKARYRGHQAASRALAEAVTARLRFDAESRRRVLLLVEHHDLLFTPEERSIRRLLRRFGEADARALIAIRRADNLAQAPQFQTLQAELDECERTLARILREEQCVSLRQLAVKGDDLAAMGLRGKEIGATLEALLTAVVEGELPNTREALLDAAEDVQSRN